MEESRIKHPVESSYEGLHCDRLENSTPEEISACIAQTRRNMEHTLQEMRERVAPSRVYDRSIDYVKSYLYRQSQRLSHVPGKIKEHAGPAVAIGGGMLLSGITAYVLDRRSKRKAMAGGAGERRPMLPDSDVQSRRRTAHFRPAPGTFEAVHQDQASTEEIFFDQEASQNQGEYRTENRQAGTEHSSVEVKPEGLGETEVFINREVDVRLGEEQMRLAEEKEKRDKEKEKFEKGL